MSGNDPVQPTQPRVQQLLDAVIALGTDLGLEATLNQVVSTACALVNARYGALGVLAEDGQRLSQFITYGISDVERDRIGPPPLGRGLLGLLIDDPKPQRIRDINLHPLAVGFPDHHPTMTSFLGVPVRTRGQVFGNLYLTEKANSEEFTLEDETFVLALATAAGVAIENARLFEQGTRRQKWLEGAAEITEAVLGDLDRSKSLQLIAHRARTLSGADVSAVLLLDNDELRVEELDGPASALLSVGQPVVGGVAMQVARSGRPVLAQVGSGGQAVPSDSSADGLGLSKAMFVPMSSAAGMLGVLVVGDKDWNGHPYAAEELSVIGTFAGQATLALERAKARESREQLAVLQDRDRIARDLHDLVIQRLFASGLSLHTAARQVDDATGERIRGVIDDLDQTIREIRTAIFELHGSPVGGNLQAELRQVLSDAERVLGFEPKWSSSGPLGTGVPKGVEPHLVAVLREGLSNTARHAGARHAWVTLDVGSDISLTIDDDGCGVGDEHHVSGLGASGPHESGLRNLRERAANLGGALTIADRDGGGTRLRWTVPGDASADPLADHPTDKAAATD